MSRQPQGLPTTQIKMSPDVQRSLDDQGKLNRNPKAIGALIAHGEERAKHFLVERDRMVKAKR